MTKPSLETARHVATLARLQFSEEELQKYSDELLKIISSFQDLEKYALAQGETDHTPGHPLLESLGTIDPSAPENSQDAASADLDPDLEPFWEREEPNAENILETSVLLNQAPDREGVFIRVPSILDRIT